MRRYSLFIPLARIEVRSKPPLNLRGSSADFLSSLCGLAFDLVPSPDFMT
jgi:hypothetical protein